MPEMHPDKQWSGSLWSLIIAVVGKYILSCPDLMVQQSAKDVDR